jgi:superfamily I DNA/RNA helicase
MDTLRLKEGQFQIFVFTNVLKDYIRSALKLLDIPPSAVSTLDGWCMSYYQDHIGGTPPRDVEGKRPDFAAVRRSVLEHVRHAELKPVYAFILVDEGQDLDETSFALLNLIGKHVTVCMDHKQRIYEGGIGEAAVLRELGLKRRNVSLLDAYRCSPYIVELASSFIDDVKERSAYVNQARTMSSNIETPLLYIASNFEAEMDRLLDVLKTRLTTQDTIAILLPQKRQVFGVAQRLREHGFDVEHQGNKETDLDFSNRKPKVMTYHSAKGLTFDTVLLPRLVSKSFQSVPEERVRRLLFVGITRATQWVYMSTLTNHETVEISCLTQPGGPKRLTVQTTIPVATAPTPVTAESIDDGSYLDLL